MKVEMFEKIGELEIVNLRPASENKAIAEKVQAKKAEEERLRREKEKMDILLEIIPKMIEKINKSAENGDKKTSFSLSLYCEERLCHSCNYDLIKEDVHRFFENLGYNFKYFDYSARFEISW